MINHVSVRNFRCFANLEVKGLKRINVLVGRNGTGKSAFLESLFLSSATTAPSIVFQMRAFRGIGGTLQVPADALSYKGLWEDIFYNFEPDRTISIKIQGNQGDGRALKISYTQSAQEELPFGKEPSGAFALPQITFTWHRAGSSQIVIKPIVTSTGLKMDAPLVDHFPMIWFSPNIHDGAENHARRFSELSKAHATGPIIKALATEFDYIEDLSVEFLAGIPMLYAAVKGKSKRMPLGLISDGVNRLAQILIGIAYFEGGVVLIDQIEDGLYYDRMPSVWSTIYKCASSYKTQLFISTHSRECLRATLPAMKGHEDDFRLLRAETIEGVHSIDSIKGEFLESALEQEFEVR